MVEQAIAREALRLSFVQHEQFAVKLRGVQRAGSLDAGLGGDEPETLVDRMQLDLLVGSGGVLSHAPRRAQAMMMMIDAFAVEGVTELAVDSIFMMPHLGVLSRVHPAAATEVFEKDCLVYLGTCIAPVGGKPDKSGKPGKPLLEISLGGRTERLAHGELRLLPLADGARAEAVLTPARGVDVGAGPGEPVRRQLRGVVVGLVLDGRGRRPLEVPAARAARVAAARAWSDALGLYPAA